MKYTIVAFWTLFTALVAAQSISDLPTCAQECVGSSLGGCNAINITCICSNESFIADLSCCVAGDCSEEDQESTIEFANQICAVAQVSLPQSAGCSATSTASASGSSASMSMTNSAASSSASALSSSASEAASSATASASGSSSPSSAAPASESSGVAGHLLVDSALGIAGVVAAGLAAL